MKFKMHLMIFGAIFFLVLQNVCAAEMDQNKKVVSRKVPASGQAEMKASLDSSQKLAKEQSNKMDTTTQLEEVIVKAPVLYSPISAATLDKQDLDSQLTSTSDTASLLRDVPGVSLYGAGGVSSLPVIHGMADDRLRVKVDGMDLVSACPNHMNPALSYVDPAQVEDIQVFAGITPVSLGGDSIGGTIVVNTTDPEFASGDKKTLLKGKANTFYRSNGNGFGGSVSTTMATDNLSVTYSGAGSKSDNYKAAKNFKSTTATGHDGRTIDQDEVGSTAYENQNHKVGLAWQLDKHLLEGTMAFQDIPYQNYPNQRMDMLGNTEYRPSLRYLGEFDWGSLETKAFYQKVDHYMNFGDDKRYWYGALSGNGSPCSPMGPTCASGMPMYTEGKTIGASMQADINITDEDIVRLGSEMQFYRLNDWWPASGGMMWPNTFWNINDGQRDRMGFFTEWEKHFNPELMTLVGTRYEYVRMNTGDVTGYNNAGMGNQGRDATLFNTRDREKNDHNWDITALTKYSLNSLIDLALGYAHKTRSPNIYERYAWSTWSMPAAMVNWFGDGNGYIGNIDLKPEEANTISATMDVHSENRKWGVQATPYYTRVSDYIDAIQWNATTNAPATTMATNQFSVLKFANQSARLYGIDLSFQMPLVSHEIVGDFNLKGLLNYTNGKNLDTNDSLYNIMPVNTRISLTHEKGGWSSRFDTVSAGDKNDISDQRNEIRTKGYTLFNLSTSYSWKHVRIDFGIENLFDKRYALPLGGAYVGQGASMMLNPTDGVLSWGTAVPGPGRSIYTGLTLQF
jgi:iron complex outermembrane receptor protein